jgi:hypothetical protein
MKTSPLGSKVCIERKTDLSILKNGKDRKDEELKKNENGVIQTTV